MRNPSAGDVLFTDVVHALKAPFTATQWSGISNPVGRLAKRCFHGCPHSSRDAKVRYRLLSEVWLIAWGVY
jgi:hypothetical protein